MTVRRYIGAAATVANVKSYEIGGTVEVGDRFQFTIGAKTLDVSAESTTPADVAQQIADEWAALDSAYWPEFAELTATANGDSVQLTANEAGKPIDVTVSTVEANGGAADAQTITENEDVPNSGPHDIAVADNWSGSALPVNGDIVVIDLDSPSLRWNLDALASVVATSVRITPSRNTEIGLPETADGGYPESRPKAFAIQAADWFVETESGLVNVDIGDGTATEFVCRGTGSRTQTKRAALCIQGNNSGHVLIALRGDIAIQQAQDEDTRFGTIRTGFISALDTDVTLYCGAGATLGAFVQNGGQVETWSALSSLTMRGGLHRHNAGGITSPVVYAGRLAYNAEETLAGTAKVGETGHIDFSEDPRPKTITNPIEVYGAQAKVSDPFNVCNASGNFAIDLNETASLANLVVGANRRVTFAATA